MRIPQYEQQVNTPNAPQFSQIADVRNDNLSVIADGLNEVYKVKLKEQEEAQKTAFFQADTSIQMALDKAKFDIAERIKNGGSYANAEAEYQKAHDAAIAQFASAFDADKSGNTKLRAMAEYQSRGLDNLMSLRDMVTARRKSDTAASANLRAEQLSQQMLDATPEQAENIKKQIASLYASATAATGGSPDEGRLKAMKAIQGAEQNRYQLFMQNNAENPQAQLDEIERLHKEKLVDTDFYIQARGSALNDIYKIDSTESFIAYAQNPQSGKKPTQQSTDIFYDEKLNKPFQNGEISQDDYENGVLDMVKISGKIPTQLEGQIKTTLSMYRENMPVDYKQSVVSNARVVSKMYDQSPMVFTKEGAGLNKKDVTTAQTIINRINAGVPEEIAVDETLKMVSDVNYGKAYDKAIKESLDSDDLKDYVVDELEIEDGSWPLIQSKARDLYAMSKAIGAADGDAKENAVKYLSKQYGEFDGVSVKYPPDKVTNIQDKKQWLRLAQRELNNFYSSEFPDQVIGTTAVKKFGKAILAGDEQTKRELENNSNPSFVLHYQTIDGALVPVYDKSGQKVRIAGEPSKEDDVIMPILSSKLFGGTFLGPVKLGGYTKEEQMKLEAGMELERQRMRGELK